VIDKVEFRIDGGAWSEATYEVVPSELEAGTPFTWNISLNPNALSKGNHTVEVRAVSGEMSSLPVLVSVTGNGKGLEAQSSGILMYTIGFVVLVMLAAAIIGWRMDSAIFKLSGIAPNQDEVLDAELVSSPVVDYSSMTNSELKDLLRERGLPLGGNKQDFIDRLNDG